MTASRGPIVLMTGSRSAPETRSEAGDVQALRELGWDAHLVMRGPGRPPPSSVADWFHCCSGPWARLGAARAMARGAAAGPVTAARSLRTLEGGTGAWCRRQLTGHLLALRPKLVHFDSGRW